MSIFANKKLYSYNPSLGNVRAIGRTWYCQENSTMWFALSGAGLEFLFYGSKCQIELIADGMWVSPEHCARYAIYVNEVQIVDQLLSEPRQLITVCDLPKPEHITIKVIKISESCQSTMGIGQINIDSPEGIEPTKPKKKLIEFVGDSITCGYGVDLEDYTGKFTTATEDFRKSYAYLAASDLDCDYSMVSYSGYGIISGYTESDEPHPDILPPIYDAVGCSMGKFNCSTYPQNIKWDFLRQPDLLVVNLGTNDMTYVRDVIDRKLMFMNKYIDFLMTLRRYNPAAPILCTLGIMGDELFDTISDAVREYSRITEDINIRCIRLEPQCAEDGYAVGWHPTYKSYIKAANRLVKGIREWLSW